jgi:cyclophilin family peptidyl-prolyl cis-trans isomerase
MLDAGIAASAPPVFLFSKFIPFRVFEDFVMTPLLRVLGWCRVVGCLLAYAAAMGAGGRVHAADPVPVVRPIPEPLRREFSLAPFYQRHVVVEGLPILGSSKISDNALREAAWILQHMLPKRADVLHAMASNHVRLAVMAWNEFTTDIPEHSNLTPKIFWDRRARGLGASPEAPAVSCAEENLLCYRNDPYSTENILIHEFAHAIHLTGMNALDPTFDERLAKSFHSATNRGLWKSTYAASNREEYWAEATQSWFDNNRANDALHNDIDTRDKLKRYDPGVAALCLEVYGDLEWRYHKPAQRSPEGRAHLTPMDPVKTPIFEWPDEPVGKAPVVSIQTALGDIEVELDATKAPVTTRNFLRYVRKGFYSDGRFHRAVTPQNQPTNQIRIEVIQADSNPARMEETDPPIALERTRDTGLKHLDGTISMARDGVDSATSDIFICIGDQPELDFGGRRNPDGQGFAAFGRVIKGMDVVRLIQSQPADGQTLMPPVRIQRALRLK